MLLARIITRHPDDARELHQQLLGRGYQVEYADPSALIAEPADLEIDLERLPLEDGLRLASEWAAEAGSDVYFAPGALRAMESKSAEQPPVAPEVVPSLPIVAAPEQILEQQSVIGDQAASDEHEPQMEAASRDGSAEAESVAEISSAVPLTFTQPEQPAQPEDERREEPAVRSEVLMDAVTNAAGIFADSLHETREAISQGLTDLKHRFTPERQTAAKPSLFERWRHALAERLALRQERKNRERDIARLVRDERARREARALALAQDLRELRARKTAARPPVVQGSAAPVMHQHAVNRSSPKPVLERRMHPPRRDAQRDEGAEYWRGAFTGAAVVAAVLMIAWATLGTTRPPAPPHSTGQIKQDVPFGPVTLTPSVSLAKPAGPALATPQPVTQSPTPRATAPARKPAPVRSHRVRRNSDGGVANGEVVVRHFGAPKPAPTPSNATAKNSGPKRISDQ